MDYAKLAQEAREARAEDFSVNTADRIRTESYVVIKDDVVVAVSLDWYWTKEVLREQFPAILVDPDGAVIPPAAA